MYLTIYSPGSDVARGDFRARFLSLDGNPPVITADVGATIGGTPIILHPSSYDTGTREYIVPFTIEEQTLDGTNISIGLLTLLGASTRGLKLLSVEKDITIPLEIPVFLGALLLILLLRRM